jgi:hypothetical protein
MDSNRFAAILFIFLLFAAPAFILFSVRLSCLTRKKNSCGGPSIRRRTPFLSRVRFFEVSIQAFPDWRCLQLLLLFKLGQTIT